MLIYFFPFRMKRWVADLWLRVWNILVHIITDTAKYMQSARLSTQSSALGHPTPLSRERMLLPPLDPRAEHTRFRVRRWEVPIRTTGEKAQHSVYSVILTSYNVSFFNRLTIPLSRSLPFIASMINIYVPSMIVLPRGWGRGRWGWWMDRQGEENSTMIDKKYSAL